LYKTRFCEEKKAAAGGEKAGRQKKVICESSVCERKTLVLSSHKKSVSKSVFGFTHTYTHIYTYVMVKFLKGTNDLK